MESEGAVWQSSGENPMETVTRRLWEPSNPKTTLDPWMTAVYRMCASFRSMPLTELSSTDQPKLMQV